MTRSHCWMVLGMKYARAFSEGKFKIGEELMRLVKDNFAVLIDYWAVDWNHDGLTFKSEWQDLRGLGRKTKVVTTEKEHIYEKSGKHIIAIRVVDIFGNDATATIDIKT
jgi:adenine-specific DNA-methyltransferase